MKKTLILSIVICLVGVFSVSAQRKTTVNNRTVCPVENCVRDCPRLNNPRANHCVDCPNYQQCNRRNASCCGYQKPRYKKSKHHQNYGCYGQRAHRRTHRR